jgi:hypothetical protein
MQKTKRSYRKMMLALAGVALLSPVGHTTAQTLTPQFDELILGFRATGGQGLTVNLEVDLGNVSQFYNATPGSTISLPALSVQDLANVYGTSWSTRTDLVWGAVATTGRAAGTSDGHAPVGTLWATDPTGQAAWNRGSVFAQKTASPNIEAMIVPGSAGSLYGATPTVNSSESATIDATEAGSWTIQDLKTAGTSFGYWNPTIDDAVTNPASGQAVSALYELQPTNVASIAGTFLGDLVLTPSGLSFQAVPPISAPLRVLSIARSGNDITLTWTAPGGTTNVVQATPGSNGSYTTNGFAAISGQIINSGAANVAVTNQYTESFGATNRPSRFYRVQQVP